MADPEHEEDKKILIEILMKIERQLYFIVFEVGNNPRGEPRFRKEFVELFPGPWNEVAASFQGARTMIEKDEINWQYVEGLGMAGSMLKWKKSFLDETIKSKAVGRFLKIANSILGSLSKAIPALEIVKEYKDHVEAAMRYVRG